MECHIMFIITSRLYFLRFIKMMTENVGKCSWMTTSHLLTVLHVFLWTLVFSVPICFQTEHSWTGLWFPDLTLSRWMDAWCSVDRHVELGGTTFIWQDSSLWFPYPTWNILWTLLPSGGYNVYEPDCKRESAHYQLYSIPVVLQKNIFISLNVQCFVHPGHFRGMLTTATCFLHLWIKALTVVCRSAIQAHSGLNGIFS